MALAMPSDGLSCNLVFSSLQSLQQLVWGVEMLWTTEGAVGIAHQKKTQGPLLGKSLH